MAKDNDKQAAAPEMGAVLADLQRRVAAAEARADAAEADLALLATRVAGAEEDVAAAEGRAEAAIVLKLRIAGLSRAEVDYYWLRKSAYLQQVGESEPSFIVATPDNPVKVLLPNFVVRDGARQEMPLGPHLTKAKPEPPVPEHPAVLRKLGAKAANRAAQVAAGARAEGVRAADQ